uniref:Uncharacterized protein n=1 Tax=Anguilla anguilla TaxID=7936 RepID=A0A0E9UHY6_ANGAN
MPYSYIVASFRLQLDKHKEHITDIA